MIKIAIIAVIREEIFMKEFFFTDSEFTGALTTHTE
jgi:hypothetical protein